MPVPKGTHLVTEQLLDLLELLTRYKYLRTTFIRKLLDCGEQGIVRQLQRRTAQGYIYQPKEQKRGYNSLWSPRIHSITKKGAQLLKIHGREPGQTTRLYRPITDGPVKNFAHSMMICDTLASIEIGLQDTGATFIPWTDIIEASTVPDPMRIPFDSFYNGQVLSGKIVPDGLFGIRYPDGKTSYFALEAEHFVPIEPKDLERSSTLKKLLAYKDIIQRKRYQQTGATNLRVLFVTPTKARADTSCELAARLFGSTNAFLFHPVPVQEELLKAPPPFPQLATGLWKRAGMEPTALYK